MLNTIEHPPKPIPALKDFQLAEDQLSYVTQLEDDTLKPMLVGVAEVVLQHGGQTFNLGIRHEQIAYSASDHRINVERYNYTVADLSHQPAIEGSFNVTDLSALDGLTRAGVLVHRVDPTVEMPKGVGLILYEKILERLARLAHERNTTIRHVAQRFPQISKTPMSNEQWDKIFVPILEHHGYQPVPNVSGEWTKDYLPR